MTILGVLEIESIIPHRLPMRLIDEVTMWEKDEGILEGTVRKGLQKNNDPVFNNPFIPECSVALAIEICAQIAAVATLQDKKDAAILFESIHKLKLNPYHQYLQPHYYQYIDLDKADFTVMTIPEDNVALIEVTGLSEITKKKEILISGEIKCVVKTKNWLKRIAEIIPKRHPCLPCSNSLKKLSFFEQLQNINPSESLMIESGNLLISQTLYLKENDEIINGHFPENSIMPGVFILLPVIKIIRKVLEKTGLFPIPKIDTIEEFKFLKPIIPPSVLEIKILATDDGYKAEVLANDSIAATGLIKLLF